MVYKKDLQTRTTKDGLKELSPNDITTLIASYVFLGKSYEVKDILETHGKDLRPGYSSHYVKVKPPNFLPLASPENLKGPIYDEFVVNDSSRILPRFIMTLRRIEKVLIWRDPKLYTNTENKYLFSIFKKLEDVNIYPALNDKEVMNIIDLKHEKNKLFLITNGSQAESLVQTIRLKFDFPILVFCFDLQIHKKWASEYSNIQVTNMPEKVQLIAEEWNNGTTSNYEFQEPEEEKNSEKILFEMGFENETLNKELLKKYNNDVNQVIQELLKH